MEELNNQQGSRLLKLQKIGDIEVVVHTTLNTTKGVVVCRELLNCSEEETVTELAFKALL